MAAITVVSGSDSKEYLTVRTASAQATTGQTDWLNVPNFAKTITVFFNLTANAGTTPTSTPSILAADPITRDDGDTATMLTGATITTASTHIYSLGANVTTSGTDQAAADAFVVQNSPLPTLLGIKILNDRGDANETYTYTIFVKFAR